MSGRTPAEWREYSVYWAANPATCEIRRYTFVGRDCLITKELAHIITTEKDVVMTTSTFVVRMNGTDAWVEYLNLPLPWQYLGAV